MSDHKETITITYGDFAENHVGMQKIGKGVKKGMSVKKLKNIQEYFEKQGVQCDFFDLCEEADFTGKAAVLVIRKGVDFLLETSADDMMGELQSFEWDKKAFMKGRVVNKHARHNVCFSEKEQKPDYENKKGTIVAFKEVPLIFSLKKRIEKIMGLDTLVGEGNRYYDPKNCGIGFHGDGERRIVIGCRFGADMPLYFMWFHKSEAVSKRMCIELSHGDIYIMSRRAVGYNWLMRNTYTLRHAAGFHKKFIEPKKKAGKGGKK